MSRIVNAARGFRVALRCDVRYDKGQKQGETTRANRSPRATFLVLAERG